MFSNLTFVGRVSLHLKACFALVVLVFPVYAAAALPIQQWTTASGVKVLLVENRQLPMLDVAVALNAGTRFNTEDKQGLAQLTVQMLAKGADGLSDDTLSKKFANIGVVFDNQVDNDMAVVQIRTLSQANKRDAAVDLLSKILLKPDFDQARFVREKKRFLGDAREAAIDPERIAYDLALRKAYGSHPYGFSSGTVDTINKIERQDLVDFYQRYYRAQGAVVALVGDIDRTQAEKIADKLTAFPPNKHELPLLPPVVLPQKAETIYLPHPASQASIMMVLPFIDRHAPDYQAVLLGDYILGGGGFDSRLMQQVRVKKGYAYSVGSYWQPYAQPGPLTIFLQTRKDQSADALQTVNQVLDDVLKKGVTQAELDQARQNILGAFPLRTSSNANILERLTVIGFYDFPLDYLEQYQEKVKKVTLQDVQKALNARLKPQQMVTVVVGAPVEK